MDLQASTQIKAHGHISVTEWASSIAFSELHTPSPLPFFESISFYGT